MCSVSPPIWNYFFGFVIFFEQLFSANSKHFLLPSKPGLTCIFGTSFLFYIRPVSLRNSLKHMGVIPPHSSPPVEFPTVLVLCRIWPAPIAWRRHRGISAAKPLTKKVLKTLLHTYRGQIEILYFLWRFRVSREDRLISNSTLLHLRHLFLFSISVENYSQTLKFWLPICGSPVLQYSEHMSQSTNPGRALRS